MATLIGSNDYLQFAETSETTDENGITTRTFTVTNLSPYPDGDVNDVELQPQFSNTSSSTYKGHEATRGTYNSTTNTWSIGTLGPGESASITIDTDDCEEESSGSSGGGGGSGGETDGTPPDPCTTDTPRGSRIISNPTGQKKIINDYQDGTSRISNLNLAPAVGDKVFIQDSECGYITTGATSRESQFTTQTKTGLSGGSTECNVQPGDRAPYTPGDGDGNGNGGTVEPDGDECLREYSVAQVRSAYDYSYGINGGTYYKVSFGNPGCDFEGGDMGGIWLYPGMEPEFLLDVHLSMETAEDPREAKPTCWGPMKGQCAGCFGIVELCMNESGDVTDESCDCENPDSYCCIKTCSAWKYYDCGLWNNQQLGADHCSPKYQFWYPYGGIWIYCKEYGTQTNEGGLGGEMAYPTGYVMVEDLKSSWQMINAPVFALSPNSDDFEPYYDPKAGGGIGGAGFSMDDCRAKYQNQGLSSEEIDFLCQQKEKPDVTGWSECMVRLYNRNPNLTYDELVSLCDEHGSTQTTCVIDMMHQNPEMSEDEAIEQCKDTPDSYTLRFRPMNQTGRPFLLSSMVFYVGGTAGCMWGHPEIPLYWSCPSTTIGPLRVCPTRTNDLEGFGGIHDREDGIVDDLTGGMADLGGYK